MRLRLKFGSRTVWNTFLYHSQSIHILVTVSIDDCRDGWVISSCANATKAAICGATAVFLHESILNQYTCAFLDLESVTATATNLGIRSWPHRTRVLFFCILEHMFYNLQRFVRTTTFSQSSTGTGLESRKEDESWEITHIFNQEVGSNTNWRH